MLKPVSKDTFEKVLADTFGKVILTDRIFHLHDLEKFLKRFGNELDADERKLVQEYEGRLITDALFKEIMVKLCEQDANAGTKEGGE